MSWTEIARIKYRRDGLRYASDTTDEEWALIEPPMPAKFRVGRPRETKMRAVLDAIFYIIETGCQWRMLPKDFPPFTTVQGYFHQWRDDGRWESINHHLLMQALEVAGREASPSAGVIDSHHRGGWSARLRRRQEDQGPQATHPHRHQRTAGRRGRPCGGYPGSRRRTLASELDPKRLPVAAPRLRRWRLCGRKTRAIARATRQLDDRHRQAVGCCLAAGSGPSPGSTATAGLPRTSRNQSPPPWRGS